MERFLKWFTGHLNRRVIDNPECPELGPLLTRYFVLHTRWLGIFIHHLHRSDSARDTHDHPWNFVTILLTGGYLEHAVHKHKRIRCHDCMNDHPVGRYGTIRLLRRVHMEYIKRFSVNWRPATWEHRLELQKPIWTLVFRFSRHRTWGFHTATGWVPFQIYSGDC